MRIGLCVLAVIATSRIATGVEPVASFVGAAVCSQCHEKAYREWAGARHGKMLQPANASSVEADFHRASILLRGEEYRVRAENGVYYITESAISGKRREYRVDYTLGSRRIQHYLTKLSDGRIVVLAPSWDVTRKQWFHNMDIVNPEEYDGGVVQVWNKNCFSCHVSREEKRYDAAHDSYNTTWQDFGTSCERCHGPGTAHVARYRDQTPSPTSTDTIVVPTRLDAARSTMICAQCHSLRDIVSQGYTAGSSYYDYYLPILEYGERVLSNDPSYWADGRPRRFSDDAVGFWQSECFLKGGAACSSCHSNAHDPEVDKNAALRPGSNGICTQCHKQIGQSVSAHTRHASSSAGSSCVECHMPRTVFSIKAGIRDHSISVPAPENTDRFRIPNACNVCHSDRTAGWATATIKEWYARDNRVPSGAQKWIRRAEAFSKARAGDTKAVDLLLAIYSEPTEGFITRANAIGHLSRFADDARVPVAMERALGDPQPLVRAVAALRIPRKGQAVNKVAMQRALIRALGDPIRTVRVGAVLSLVDIGLPALFGEDAQRFAQAKREYLSRAQILDDDAPEQFNAAAFELLSGDATSAAAILKNTLLIDPSYESAKQLLFRISSAVEHRDGQK
jgi:Cytochrome c552/Cytochrome c554 and c-prime